MPLRTINTNRKLKKTLRHMKCNTFPIMQHSSAAFHVEDGVNKNACAITVVVKLGASFLFDMHQNNRTSSSERNAIKPLKNGVHYSYYVKSTSLQSETALSPPQTLLAKILDT